jgi:hypothetical protein
MTFGEVVAIVVGTVGVVWLVTSAIRTVVVPRPERVWITTTSFEVARRLSSAVAQQVTDPARRNRVLGTFAPVVLIGLPLLWSIGLISAFAAIFWGLDVGSLTDSIELSGSSLTTLGFVAAPTFETRLIAVIEALFGVALVALMISFLPTIYGTFSRREIVVGRLTTRAGEPPDPVEFISRLVAVDRLGRVDERWGDWEDWFDELGETHTTFPALIYFRSARPGRSWLAAAEVSLDTAAILRSTDLTPETGQADVMVRSGYLALRAIADFYGIEEERDPADAGDLSVSQADFDRLLAELVAEGVPVDVDPDRAWHAYRGWRVNYDRAVCGLRAQIGDDPSHWTKRRQGADDEDERRQS